MESRIHYASTEDGVSIAYTTFGTPGAGGVPLVCLRPPSMSHIQLEMHTPFETDLHEFETMSRERFVVRFDTRGSGLSDRGVEDVSLEARLLDIEAVVAALKLERFAIQANFSMAAPAIAYAARHPEQVTHLALTQPYASGADYWALRRSKGIDLLWQNDWRTFTELFWAVTFDWGRPELSRALAAHMRASITAEDYTKYAGADAATDVTPLLRYVEAPTLICHYPLSGMRDLEESKRIAARIPNSNLALVEEMDQALAALSNFLGDGASREGGRATSYDPSSSIQTILFTDIEDHDGLVERLGDDRSRDVFRAHEQITREALRQHGGHEVKALGDGFMASFSSAAGAIECAAALQRQIAFIGNQLAVNLRVRIGINAGEPIAEDGDLFGNAVIAAARISALAAGGEVLVSNVVRELTAGKGFMFSDRGEAGLRGMDDPVRLWQLHL